MIRKFIFKLSAIVMPVALLIIFLNYFIDPANIFSSEEYTGGIAYILSKGHNVDKASNYDERMLQEQMLTRLSKPPDIIVLGSSRIMEIGSDFFPGKQVLNCGVSHANIHDLIALTGLLDSLKKFPHLLVINVDPGLISKGTLEWQTLSVYHDYMMKKLAIDNNLNDENSQSNYFHKLYSLLSFDYFKSSVDFFLQGASKKYADVGSSMPSSGRFSDGTICYSQKHTHPDTVRIAYNAKETATKEGLKKSDPARVLLLEKLLDFLQAGNIRIKMLMLPFHPDYYNVVNSRQRNVFHSIESLFRDIAKKKNIQIAGSFDPNIYGINGSEFYDMYHCSKDAIKKVIE